MWYLSHSPEIHKTKSTIKVRVVFYAASKTNGICLNDAIHQGPKFQGDLYAVLTKFRIYLVALVCDIAEVSLRIGLAPQN